MPRAAADPRPPCCPCGRNAAYAECCGRWHAGALHLAAPDAETLMRSRYSAYVLRLVPYLLDTWHAGTRPAALDLDPTTKWLGLEVRGHHRVDETHATVEFVARYRDAGRATRLHETSRFVREDGRWCYVDGELR